MAYKTRQEINILNRTVNSLSSGGDQTLPEGNLCGYGTPHFFRSGKQSTWYLEIVAKNTNATTAYTVYYSATSNSSISIPANTSTFTLFRSSGLSIGYFNLGSLYNLVLPQTASAGQVSVKAARLVILQSINIEAYAFDNISNFEIGNYETIATKDVAVPLAYPKYFYYDSNNWDPTVSGVVVQLLWSSTGAYGTTEIYIQEDDGNFGTWSNKTTIISTSYPPSYPQWNGGSFTPTSGRNYRLAVYQTVKSNVTIYKCDLVIASLVPKSSVDMSWGDNSDGGRKWIDIIPSGTHVAKTQHSAYGSCEVFKKSGTDNYDKISSPFNSIPSLTGQVVKFSPDGNFLAIGFGNDGYTTPTLAFYSRSGDSFTKLTNPATIPYTTIYDISWCPNSTYIAVAADEVSGRSEKCIYVYKRSGNTFTSLTLDYYPPSTGDNLGRAVNFDRTDGSYLAFSYGCYYPSPNYQLAGPVIMYERSGDTFTKQTNSLYDWSVCVNLKFSPNSSYLVGVVNYGGGDFLFYKRSGSTFTQKTLDFKPTAQGGGFQFVSWADSSKFLVTGGSVGSICIVDTSDDLIAVQSTDFIGFPSGVFDVNDTNFKTFLFCNNDGYMYAVRVTGDIIKFETSYQMVVINYSTSGQSYYLTKWDPSEWERITNVYYYEHSATSSSTTSVRGVTSGSLKAITGTNRTRSSTSFNMPASAENLDTWYGS